MYVVSCPSCGAPVRVKLAQPDRLSCAHCATTTATPPEVRTQLDAAAQLLATADVTRRQLSTQRARALSLARPWRFTFLSLALAFLCFAGASLVILVATSSVRHGIEAEIREGAWLCTLVAMSLTTLGGIALVWRAQLRLELACAAVPPRAAGEPVECRLCGAPLSQADDRGVVRCGFCQADNLVSRAALEQAAGRLRQASASLAEHVDAEARAATTASRWPLWVIAASTLIAPIASLLGVGALVTFAKNRPLEYVALPKNGEQCLLRVHHHMLGWEYFGKDGARIWREMTPARPDVPRLSPSALVGRKVYSEGGIGGTVVRAAVSERYPELGIYLQVRHGERTVPIHATDTCLVSEPEPQELALWKDYDSTRELALAQDDEHLFLATSKRLLVIPKQPGRWVVLQPHTDFIDALSVSGKSLRYRTLSKYWKEIPDYRAPLARATQTGETVALWDGETRDLANGSAAPEGSAAPPSHQPDRRGLPPIVRHDEVLATLHDAGATYWVATTPSNYVGFPPSALIVGRRALRR